MGREVGRREGEVREGGVGVQWQEEKAKQGSAQVQAVGG